MNSLMRYVFQGGFNSVPGAAASLLVLLAWLYYFDYNHVHFKAPVIRTGGFVQTRYIHGVVWVCWASARGI